MPRSVCLALMIGVLTTAAVSARQAPNVATRESTMKARVESVERSARLLTLRDDVNTTQSIYVDPSVKAFDQLRPGDMVTVRGQDLHGVAPVAMQQGRHVARSIRRGERTPFRYNDKGELATIGRARAVGTIHAVMTGARAWRAAGSRRPASGRRPGHRPAGRRGGGSYRWR